MNTEEKREYLIKRITEELEKDPIKFTYSSPTLKSATRGPIIIAKGQMQLNEPHPLPNAIEENVIANTTIANPPSADIRIPKESYAIQQDDIYDNLTQKQAAKARKKEAKEALKQAKRDKKAYSKMQKDITKRGFDTAVLQRLNDPADIYHMSDDEIKEIEIAGVINNDGYYNFVYPEDYDSAKQQKTSRKTFFIIGGFIFVVTALLVILINNIFSMF